MKLLQWKFYVRIGEVLTLKRTRNLALRDFTYFWLYEMANYTGNQRQVAVVSYLVNKE